MAKEKDKFRKDVLKMYFDNQNMRDDNMFIISSFKRYIDLVKKHDTKPDNWRQYD